MRRRRHLIFLSSPAAACFVLACLKIYALLPDVRNFQKTPLNTYTPI